MPDRDGLDLAKAINEDTALPRPVLILLTSRGEKLPHSQLESHRFAACELKPLHAKSLHETIGRALANVRAIAPVTNQPAEPETTVAQFEEVRILVAEDNPVNQKVTLLQLRNLGYAADLVCNGREALAAVQKKSYSLVLMDAQMPDIDGVEATRQIREAQAAGNPAFPPSLNIVAMTANAMTGDREICLAAGMDDYLAKPVKSADLRKILERYLNPDLTASQSVA
jgi:CheY-like chemotaxis protein